MLKHNNLQLKVDFVININFTHSYIVRFHGVFKVSCTVNYGICLK